VTLKISQYPRNADGTPMDLMVGVVTDASGNNGARLTNVPVGPDNAPIDAKGVVLVDKDGNPISQAAAAPPVVPQTFYQATDPDYQNAMQGALDYLKAQNYNANSGGYYGGSQKLFIPAGPQLPLHAPLDIRHTLIIEGEGSGQTGPGSHGCSSLKWTANSSGIRVQHPATTGDTTYVPAGDQQGSGGCVIRDLMLEGGFDGSSNEGDYHGVNIRSATHMERVYIRNWQGEGIHAWAGVVGGGVGMVGGNASTSGFYSVKTEGNRGGMDIQGTDANVILSSNCEVYLNRQFGYRDWNGAGGNVVVSMHAATNGQVTGAWTQPQCSYGGHRYWLAIGGDSTVAPSGTTADTANWLWAQAGGAIANTIPAWVNTPGAFRVGGDYLTYGTAGVHLINCYSEGGGFSQFNGLTIIDHGAMGDNMYRGGQRRVPQYNGIVYKMLLGGSMFLDAGYGSTDVGLWWRAFDGSIWSYIDALAVGTYLNAGGVTGYNFRVAGTLAAQLTAAGLDLQTGTPLKYNGQQVVGARGAAVADATDAASAITQLNALLARMRAHGLIA